jgi:hypothetical protein
VRRPVTRARASASSSGSSREQSRGVELGRVARPPIHDVLRMAHFLQISPEEINSAVFEDAGEVGVGEVSLSGKKERKSAGDRVEPSLWRSVSGDVPRAAAAPPRSPTRIVGTPPPWSHPSRAREQLSASRITCFVRGRLLG